MCDFFRNIKLFCLLILFLPLFLNGCSENIKEIKLFTPVSTSQTNVGIRIDKQDKDISYLTGGSALGDLNNDGLVDIVLAKEKKVKIYLNQGGLTFKDITSDAKISFDKNFNDIEGVLLADANNDNYNDLYVLTKGLKWNNDSTDYTSYGQNKLFINNQDNTFSEESIDFNLNIKGWSKDAIFFDYDNDGDLDLYVVQWPLKADNIALSNRAFDFSFYKAKPVNHTCYDKLYENINGKYFKDVTQEANILMKNNFGNSVNISDINNDGWLDVYVANDFFGQDFLYINNKNKTFSENAEKFFGPTTLASMGSDFADINNDGWTDLFVGEMLPRNKVKQQMNVLPYSLEIFRYFKQYNIPQYQRNMLHLNRRGERFDETGFLAGVHVC
jgi:hypothetical protein